MKPPEAGTPDPGPRSEGPSLGTTWPLFNERMEPSFPEDPKLNVQPFRPHTGELEALERRTDVPETSAKAEEAVRKLRQSQPPVAPDWTRAARALVTWLEQRLNDASISAADEATISRTWAAFALGGATEPQILRVAHVVSRAHSAIRDTARTEHELQNAMLDCARVLHGGLPSAIRDRMPVDRSLQVVRRLRQEPDAWSAVVEGTSELLGWTDYARTHAAATIRSIIERGR